jgi:hypothetical protein
MPKSPLPPSKAGELEPNLMPCRVQKPLELARLRALFNWAIEKDRVAASPVARMKQPTQEQARDNMDKLNEINALN